jgi:hypothetical protein
VWIIYKHRIDPYRNQINRGMGSSVIRELLLAASDDLLPVLARQMERSVSDPWAMVAIETMMGDIHRYCGDAINDRQQSRACEYGKAEDFYLTAIGWLKGQFDDNAHLLTDEGLHLIESLSLLLSNQPHRKREAVELLESILHTVQSYVLVNSLSLSQYTVDHIEHLSRRRAAWALDLIDDEEWEIL